MHLGAFPADGSRGKSRFLMALVAAESGLFGIENEDVGIIMRIRVDGEPTR